jgi:hypothetical protein
MSVVFHTESNLCQHSNCKRTDLLDPTDSVVRTTPVGSSHHPARPIVQESTAFGDCAPATHPISDMHEAVSRNFTKSILQQAFAIAEIYGQVYEQLLSRKANAVFKRRMHATTTTVHYPQGKKRKTELQAEPTNAGKTPVIPCGPDSPKILTQGSRKDALLRTAQFSLPNDKCWSH